MNPINVMCCQFRLTPMESYLLLVVPRFTVGAVGGATTFRRHEVERDLRDSIADDDTDKTETLALINRLHLLPLTSIGWYVLGVRSMVPTGEIIERPGGSP